MTARLLAIAGWLAAGHAVLAGLYWLLLAIPESNIAMLAASALTVVTLVLAFGWIEAVGLLAWQPEERRRDLPRRGIGKAPGVWIGAVLFVAAWFLVALAQAHWDSYRGEIDAWLMAQFGWTTTGGLHDAVRWLLAFVRFLGLSLAVSLAWAFVSNGFAGIRSIRWVRDAVSPRRLLVLGGILLVFVWLPWRSVNWRPAWLAPNWQESTFVVLKLGSLYLLANLGWALVLGSGARRIRTSP